MWIILSTQLLLIRAGPTEATGEKTAEVIANVDTTDLSASKKRPTLVKKSCISACPGVWPDARGMGGQMTKESAYPKTSQSVLVFQPLQRVSHLLRGLIQLFLTFSAVAEGSQPVCNRFNTGLGILIALLHPLADRVTLKTQHVE